MLSIGVIGDHDPANETHLATSDALGHSAMALGTGVDVTWVPTLEVAKAAEADEVASLLAPYDALIAAPGSPYESMAGMLAGIEHARTAGVPFLGTCGGMQHLVIEFARNVLGRTDAESAEHDPYASTLFVTPLTCTLAGQTLDVTVTAGTRAEAAYGTTTVTERYYCNFGVNPDVVGDLAAGGLVVTGTDETGEPRIVELDGHPFLVGTLFVPQARSTLVRPHPLVTALVSAAADA
jgi:CTP synthase (UTP-ammonia lyase)